MFQSGFRHIRGTPLIPMTVYKMEQEGLPLSIPQPIQCIFSDEHIIAISDI
jgi:hypothetical protein